MNVSVKLFADLAGKLPEASSADPSQPVPAGTPVTLKLPDGATIATLVSQLRLDRRRVHTAFVNGRAKPLEYVLEADDEIGLFPPIGGG